MINMWLFEMRISCPEDTYNISEYCPCMYD